MRKKGELKNKFWRFFKRGKKGVLQVLLFSTGRMRKKKERRDRKGEGERKKKPVGRKKKKR